MKKILILIVAVAFTMTGCKQNQPNTASSTEGATATTVAGQCPKSCALAYVDADKVLMESDFYKAEGEPLRKKTEKTQASLAQREKNLQNEMVQLQDKYQRGLMTTRDAQTQQENLEKKAMQYQNSAQREMKTLEEENFVFNNRAHDLVQRGVKDINASGRYKMIVSAVALIDADSTLDITKQVLEAVNKIYAAEKDNKKSK